MLTNATRSLSSASRPDAVIVPLHHDGWRHFRQDGNDLKVSFDALGFGARLKMLEPGVATDIDGPA